MCPQPDLRIWQYSIMLPSLI